MSQVNGNRSTTNILVECDEGGFFVVSFPNIQGTHADGETLEEAMKNLDEVVDLLEEYRGDSIAQTL